jgi:hypothetical protein
MISSAMAPDFMPPDFMPPDLALSIFMPPEVMTSHADLCFGELIPAISLLAIQFSAQLPICGQQEARISAAA